MQLTIEQEGKYRAAVKALTERPTANIVHAATLRLEQHPGNRFAKVVRYWRDHIARNPRANGSKASVLELCRGLVSLEMDVGARNHDAELVDPSVRVLVG